MSKLKQTFIFISVFLTLVGFCYGILSVFFQSQISQYIKPIPSDLVLSVENLLLLLLSGGIWLSHNINKNIEAASRSKQQTTILATSNYSDRFLVDNIKNLMCIKDGRGKWIKASQEYLSFFNLAFVDYFEKSWLELSEYPGCNISGLEFDAEQDKKAWELGIEITDLDDSTRMLAEKTGITFARVPVYDDKHQRFRIFIYSSTSGVKNKLDASIFTAVFFSSHLPFLLLDQDFKIVQINHSFFILTGFSEQELIGNHLFALSIKQHDNLANDVKRFFHEKTAPWWSNEFHCRKKQGDFFTAEIHISKLSDNYRREKVHFVANIFDITQKKLDEERVLKIAHYDDLTDLPNRVMFCERLADEIKTAKLNKTHAVILFFDLDRFKTVNDFLGHQAGDQLLKEVAKRLNIHIAKDNIFARLGGDEFAILLTNQSSHEHAIYGATKTARTVINELSRRFHIERQTVFVGVSIGVVIFPEDGDSIDELLKHADMAMYRAKRQGQNNFRFFNRNFLSEAKNKHQLELGLHQALAKGEFLLYYQPQIKANNGALWGAEVLIRWQQRVPNGENKMISPGDFIPVAEEVGLVIPMGQWILETACSQQKQWIKGGYSIHQISVNVSARQFMDPNFVDIVEQALLKAELDPSYLELELTESMLVGDTKKIELQLNRLKKMGIKMALDDFGTGYSSLSYLKNLPIDILKIDQSFVREMTLGSKDARIVRAIINMGHSLDQKIVAEGVENESQLQYLCQQGCDIIQGYYFSRPLPVQQMSQFILDSKPMVH